MFHLSFIFTIARSCRKTNAVLRAGRSPIARKRILFYRLKIKKIQKLFVTKTEETDEYMKFISQISYLAVRAELQQSTCRWQSEYFH